MSTKDRSAQATNTETPQAVRPRLPARRTVDISRRQVLRGLGGASLALPFLPSLLRAQMGDPTYTRAPRLFWLTTDHGCAFEQSMFPSSGLLTTRTGLFSDHTVASGSLVATADGGDAVVSPILRAPSSVLTNGLVAKMNVLHGLDVPFYIAHNTGLHLGNYARNNGDGGDGRIVQAWPRPTIDQIMAWSPSFYPDLSIIRERVMIMSDARLSWNYSDPVARAGTIDNQRGYESSRALFNAVFVPPSENPSQRSLLVDRVLESYRRLRNGSRRLSSTDRQRLDDHVARVAELERKLNATASCNDVVPPTEDARSYTQQSYSAGLRYGELFRDVVATAFMCGTSRIGVLGYGDTSRFVDYRGDWHQEVAHRWHSPEPQALLMRSYQRVFAGVFAALASQLDVEEAPGMTYLDNSLLVWTQESGMEAHSSTSIPVVTFGSAAGFFRTGLYVDYRRIQSASSVTPAAGGTQYHGLLYSQWLATVLQAMRVPPAEFERWGHKGYGVPFVTEDAGSYRRHYVNTDSRYFQTASDVLPLIGA
jgi:hypothetical protein